jgi:hypothetical protein
MADIAPGLAVGLFFTIIILATLLVYFLHRRSQNKLYKTALDRDPTLTKKEFRNIQKREYDAFVKVNKNSANDLKIVYYAGHSRLSRTKEPVWST